MTEARKINVQNCIDGARLLSGEWENGVVGYHASENIGVQVDDKHMTDIAPLQDWTLNSTNGSKDYPYQHVIFVGGTRFCCITVAPILLFEQN